VFDMPQQPYERYLRRRHTCTVALWAPHSQLLLLNEGCMLRVQTTGPTRVLWTVDAIPGEHDVSPRDTSLGFWIADLDTAHLPAGAVIRLVIREGDDVVGVDDWHAITVVARPAESTRHRARRAPAE
jgi:glucoamylase